MSFEEAIEIIEEVDGEVGAIGYIINKLQETYAPKIKMTIEQRNKFMIFISEDEEFEVLWYRYGYGGELYKEFSKKELMRAWLNPKLVEAEE